VELTAKTAVARRSVANHAGQHQSLAEQRAAHQALVALLGEAVTSAFAADRAGATRTPGMPTWVAEGLARSTERESATFAAMDIG
jgi:hypothetical protein